MANVFLTDEAYTSLKMLKKGNESFSDVVKRLSIMISKKENNIDEFFGCMPNWDTSELKSAIKKARSNRKFEGA